MVIVLDNEVSNGHGVGVLFTRILDSVNEKHLIFCKKFNNQPEDKYPHHILNPNFFGIGRLKKIIFLNQWLYRLFSFFDQSEIYKLAQDQKLIIHCPGLHYSIYSSLRLIRKFPNKKHIVFFMDIVPTLLKQSSENKAIKELIKSSQKCISISEEMANYLNKAYKVKGIEFFFGPAPVGINHPQANLPRTEMFCLIGNPNVEEGIDEINKVLVDLNLTITWYTLPDRFKYYKEKYNLSRFNYGGFYSSKSLIEIIKTYKFGIIPYGLKDFSDEEPNIQNLSIPSRILDYLTAGVIPFYIGPQNTATSNYISKMNIGICTTLKNMGNAVNKYISITNNFDFQQALSDSDIKNLLSKLQ